MLWSCTARMGIPICAVPAPGVLLCRLPGAVRIVRGYCRSKCLCIGSQVLLVNLSVLINDERHHTGISILDRIRDERKTASQLSINGVILGAAGRAAALTPKQTVSVTMKWNRALFLSIAFLESLGDQWSHRTRRLTFGRLPIQAVVFTFVTQEFLCILLGVSITCLLYTSPSPRDRG